MIAKLVATGDDRDDAMMNLAAALYGLRVFPVKTNAAFLLACIQNADFRSGEVTTGLIAQQADVLTAPSELGDNEWMLAALQMFSPFYQKGEEPGAGPWAREFGFRLNAPTQARITVQHGTERRTLMLEDCIAATGFSAPVDRGALVYKDAQPFLFTWPSFSAGAASAGDGAVVAPMPGKVTSIDVSSGEKVAKGQRLLTLEAMKMEHGLTAPFDGLVAELSAEAGAQVGEGTILARIDKQETE